MFGMKRGQGATEYLVLLAVVLVIALVSIALLGFFPGLTTDAKVNQSQSYWKGSSPMAITSATIQNGNASLIVVVQNNAPDSLSAITMNFTNPGNASVVRNVVLANNALGPGATTTGSVVVTAGASTCTPGAVITLTNVMFGYNSPSFTGLSQTGSRDLIVRCS